MKERGILFSDHMVRALLAGTKSQTRRVVKTLLPPSEYEVVEHPGNGPSLESFGDPDGDEAERHFCPYGVPGNRLWVREAWAEFPSDGDIIYRASFGDDVRHADGRPLRGWLKWRPSIFLRRVHSRITLEITDVRLQRLHDITQDDAESEGITCIKAPPIPTYAHLWIAINGKGSWALNPWVFALSFKRVAQ